VEAERLASCNVEVDGIDRDQIAEVLDESARRDQRGGAGFELPSPRQPWERIPRAVLS
jgi:hypothetical protein